MKRMKKIAVAMLGLSLVAMPTIASCGGNQGDKPEPKPEAKLTSIKITAQPTKVEYESGDVFDPTGMVVKAVYDDGTEKEVKDYTYTNKQLSESDTTITISYQGKTATVNITVKFVLKVTSIAVEEKPTKTTYIVGETFDPTGMKVVANYNDNKKRVIPAGEYKIDKTGPLTLEDKTITVTYEGFKATFSIKVEEEQISGIVVTKMPTKLAYVPGEKFDPAGIEVSTITNSGKLEVVDNAKLEFEEIDAELTLETTEIVVMYNQTMSASVPIYVSESRLAKIEITRQPNIKTYVTGQKFDTVGMEITATFENGKTAKVDNKRLVIDKTKPLTLEDKVVTISLGGKSTTVEITVNEAITTVNINAITKVRIEGEHLDTTKASLRPDFINANRTFIEIPNNDKDRENTSNGQNLCGYIPGSIFEVPMVAEKKAKVAIVARISHSSESIGINEMLEFNVDGDKLTPENVKFTHKGNNDYWNWKEFLVGEVELEPGNHTFGFESIKEWPNIDCFDFIVTEYDGVKAEKTIKELKLVSGPDKTKYEIGEKFDPKGIQLEASYTDFTKAIVTDFDYDKKDALKIEDETVTLTYMGKEIVIPITVGKEYGFKIFDIGSKLYQAENFNVEGTNASVSEDGKALDFSLAGDKVSFTLYSHEASKVRLFARLKSDVEGDLNNLFKFTLNEQVLTADTAGYKVGTWAEISLGEVNLTKGGEYTFGVENMSGGLSLDYIDFFTAQYGDKTAEHKLNSIYVKENPAKLNYIEGETFDKTGLKVFGKYSDRTEEEITDYTIDKTGPLTNEDKVITITKGEFSCIVNIKVIGPTFIVDEVKDYKVEAESVDTSNITHDGVPNHVESSPNYSSGGANLAHIASGFVEIPFRTKEALKTTIEVLIAFPQAVKVSDKVAKIEIDGKVLTYEDQTLGGAPGNDYWNYKTVTLDAGTLEAGDHTFRITFKGGGNYDYFNFKFSK